MYSNRIPLPEDIASLYSEQNGNGIASFQADVYIRKDLFSKRVNSIAMPKAKFVDDYVEKGRWVDIGAGVGDFSNGVKGIGVGHCRV